MPGDRGLKGPPGRPGKQGLPGEKGNRGQYGVKGERVNLYLQFKLLLLMFPFYLSKLRVTMPYCPLTVKMVFPENLVPLVHAVFPVFQDVMEAK